MLDWDPENSEPPSSSPNMYGLRTSEEDHLLLEMIVPPMPATIPLSNPKASLDVSVMKPCMSKSSCVPRIWSEKARVIMSFVRSWCAEVILSLNDGEWIATRFSLTLVLVMLIRSVVNQGVCGSIARFRVAYPFKVTLAVEAILLTHRAAIVKIPEALFLTAENLSG